jgi:hypothetical protein
MLLHSMIIMFERKTQIEKDCKTTATNIIDLIKIVEKSQDLVALTGIYEALFKGKIQVPALAKQLEPKIQEVEIDDAPVSATKKITVATKTAFFRKEILKDNELAIYNKMKKEAGVEIEFTESEAMKKSKTHNDKCMRVKKGFSSDKMVKCLKANIEWFKAKGLHAEPFNRIVNQGSETL